MPHYPERIVPDRFKLTALRLMEVAGEISPGDDKDALLHRARNVENASRLIERWALSPGLRAPR
jgi:hypothetical protein